MGEQTAIAWTDHTFNPWWGCTKIAPECSACYAEGLDRRYGGAHWGPTAPRRTFGDKHWREPLKWDAAAAKDGVRRRVFCASMADVFEDRADLDSERARMWALISETPHLDWLLLTKRPERIAANLPEGWGAGWPNVWLGTSVGHPDSAHRAIALVDVPAAVRFLSREPLIAPVEIDAEALNDIDWIIVGGESGPKARPIDVEWARAIHSDCKGAGIAFFMKQLGGRMNKRDTLDDFPEDLRIREFPETRR